MAGFVGIPIGCPDANSDQRLETAGFAVAQRHANRQPESGAVAYLVGGPVPRLESFAVERVDALAVQPIAARTFAGAGPQPVRRYHAAGHCGHGRTASTRVNHCANERPERASTRCAQRQPIAKLVAHTVERHTAASAVVADECATSVVHTRAGGATRTASIEQFAAVAGTRPIEQPEPQPDGGA